jgi:hypothetical protein
MGGDHGTHFGEQDHQGHPHQHDPDYWQWRNEQMRALDDDYSAWRKERYSKFSDDFSQWRSQRQKGGGTGGSGTGGSSGSGTGGSAASSHHTHHSGSASERHKRGHRREAVALSARPGPVQQGPALLAADGREAWRVSCAGAASPPGRCAATGGTW